MKGTKILVIDDEAPIRKFLRVSLQDSGYEIIEAATGKEGLQKIIEVRPNLIILDLGLPEYDGLDIIQKVREWSQTPIIVLTAREDEDTKVKALDSGADDYLTKPFSVPELMARLRVAERRTLIIENEPLFRTGPLEIDFSAHIVRVNKKEIHLTATEHSLLKTLVQHAGKVVTHRQILKEIWGPNSIEHTQYLRVYMGHLRKKIESEPHSKKIILTEPGVGYRLLVL